MHTHTVHMNRMKQFIKKFFRLLLSLLLPVQYTRWVMPEIDVFRRHYIQYTTFHNNMNKFFFAFLGN